MISKNSVNQQPDSTRSLRNICEQSLAVLCEGGDSVKTKSPAETSRRRSLPLYVDPANLQKRALGDAAKALAALWKISDSKRPRLSADGLRDATA
jgi:hypothetical protein